MLWYHEEIDVSISAANENTSKRIKKTPNFLLILSPTMSLIQCNTEQSKPAIEKVESNPTIQP